MRNTAAGRSKLDLDDRASTEALAAVTRAVALRVNPGENASCLNIYQTSQPTILGVPPDMIERGGFKFVGAPEANPWMCWLTIIVAARQHASDEMLGQHVAP